MSRWSVVDTIEEIDNSIELDLLDLFTQYIRESYLCTLGEEVDDLLQSIVAI